MWLRFNLVIFFFFYWTHLSAFCFSYRSLHSILTTYRKSMRKRLKKWKKLAKKNLNLSHNIHRQSSDKLISKLIIHQVTLITHLLQKREEKKVIFLLHHCIKNIHLTIDSDRKSLHQFFSKIIFLVNTSMYLTYHFQCIHQCICFIHRITVAYHMRHHINH